MRTLRRMKTRTKNNEVFIFISSLGLVVAYNISFGQLLVITSVIGLFAFIISLMDTPIVHRFSITCFILWTEVSCWQWGAQWLSWQSGCPICTGFVLAAAATGSIPPVALCCVSFPLSPLIAVLSVK